MSASREPLTEGRLNHLDALNFILAGKSVFTLVSEKTSTRYTYSVAKAKRGEAWFVSLLTGPDNTSNYTYLGYITFDGALSFRLTKKSRLSSDAVPVKAFAWTFGKLVAEQQPPVEIWHSGRCGCCGRALTVPESIASGIGPTCAKSFRKAA